VLRRVTLLMPSCAARSSNRLTSSFADPPEAGVRGYIVEGDLARAVESTHSGYRTAVRCNEDAALRYPPAQFLRGLIGEPQLENVRVTLVIQLTEFGDRPLEDSASLLGIFNACFPDSHCRKRNKARRSSASIAVYNCATPARAQSSSC